MCQFRAWPAFVVWFWLIGFGGLSGLADERNPHWALLIGVNDYGSLTDLNYCTNDQLALREALLTAGFPDDQIVLMHDGATENRYKPFKNTIEYHQRFRRAIPKFRPQQRGERAWALTKEPERARVRFETSKPGLAPCG